MSIETAAEAARQLLSAEHDADPLDFDLRLKLMRDHSISSLAAERIIDQIRAEEALRLALLYKGRGKKKGMKQNGNDDTGTQRHDGGSGGKGDCRTSASEE